MVSPIVQRLQSLLQENPAWSPLLEASIVEAAAKIQAQPVTNLPSNVTVPTDLDSYFAYLDQMVQWVPSMEPNPDRREMYNHLVLFYFLVDQPTGVQLQQNPAFAQFLVDFANSWGSFLDTTESAACIQSFTQAPHYNVKDYFEGPSGWLTFNQFFARELRPGMRPIDQPADNAAIVSPADSVCQAIRPIEDGAIINAKGMTFDIKQLLQDSPFAARFEGGTFMHSFLNTYDYHRFHAPLAGTVVECRAIPGNVMLDVAINPDTRELEANDGTGYQFSQARGLIIIDAPGVGMVACLPIGMAQVSSVNMQREVDPRAEGQPWAIAKGEEFGYFTFGGSDMVVLFEKGIKVTAIPPGSDPNDTHKYLVGKQIAVGPVATTPAKAHADTIRN